MTAKARGFTLLEFVIVIVLISFLGIIVLNKYWEWRDVAEQTAVDVVIGNLKSALGMEVARRALRNETHLVPKLTRRNPMGLLAQQPNNYRGEYTEPFSEPETWHYDKVKRELVYNYRSQNTEPGKQKPVQIRYRIKLVFNDNNNNGRYDKGDGIGGLDIVAIK